MKKKLLGVFLTLMMVCATIAVSVSAESEATVLINGVKLVTDQPAEIIDGRTMVPLRAIFEALGADVEWFPEDRSIKSQKDNIGIVMQVGSVLLGKYDVSSNDEDNLEYIELDVAPIIKNSRTLVPVRSIAEAYGCDVKWDGAEKTVKINVEKVIKSGSYAKDNDSASYDNGILYYTLGNQSKVLFAYDGVSRQTIKMNTTPSGVVADKGYIYYISSDGSTLNRYNLALNTRKTLVDSLESIDKYYLCDDSVIIKGKDDSESDVIVRYSFKTDEMETIASFDEGILDIGKEDNRYIKIVNKIKDEDIWYKFNTIVIDTYTNEVTTLDSIIAVAQFNINCIQLNDGNVYLKFPDEEDQKNEDLMRYFKGDGKGNNRTEISKEEFNEIALKKGVSYDYFAYFDGKNKGFSRVKYVDGVRESGGSIYKAATYYYHTFFDILYEEEDLVVVQEIFTRFVGSGFDKVLDATRLFTVDTQTAEIKEIDFYATRPGTSFASGLGGASTYDGSTWSNTTGGSGGSTSGVGQSTGGATIEPTKPCGLCQGTRLMKCNMCGGDGMMPSLTAIGINGGIGKEESCRYCSGGRKQCLACKGSGKIQ